MKINLREQKIASVLLVVILLFVVSSCDKEEDPFNPLLVSVELPAGVLDSDGSVYLVASDSEGEVITFAELSDGKTIELKSDSYTAATFTLSIVSAYQSGSYKDLYGSSYHEVSRGTKLVVPEDSADDGSEYFEFNVQNFDSNTASYYTIAGNGGSPDNGGSFNINFSDAGGYLFFSKSPSRLFITKYDANYQPTGFQFPSTTYTSTQVPTINLAGNYTAFQSETVTFSEPVYAGVDVYGRLAADNYLEQYRVSSSDISGSSLSIKYPGNTFPVYSSESYVQGEDYYYEAYHKSQRSDFSLLDVDASVEIDGQTINYSVTTQGDVVSFYLEQQGGDFEYYEWEMYAPVGSNKSATIPKLPTEITNGFDSYSYTAWSTNEQVEVMEIENVGSLDEYLRADVDGRLYGALNTKRVYLYLGTGSAREARAKLAKERNHKEKLGAFKARFEKDRSQK